MIAASTPSEARQAFLDREYEKSAALYAAQLQLHPKDAALVEEYSLVLLRQQKVKEADDLVRKALEGSPQSVILMTALGEVEYREGEPALAAVHFQEGLKIDPCYPPLRLLGAKLYRLNSLYGSAVKEIRTAHSLDPYNPQIRSLWLETLPLRERIAELEKYLATSNGEGEEATKKLQEELQYLKHRLETPGKGCRLVSEVETATVPFTPIMYDAHRVRAYGLDVKFNGHDAHLQIDTGASGLLISHSVAEHAGLKESSRTEMAGIGDQGKRSGYTAVVDDIRIGSLEFRDYTVRVVDKGNIVGIDGLVGADVFSGFLVTLDYPMRQMLLAPLPKRPDDDGSVKPALTTSSGGSGEAPAAGDAEGKAPVFRGPRDRYVAPEMKDWTRIYRVGHELLIPTAINQTKQKLFLIDTGAFATTINPETAREFTKVHNDDTQVKGLSGKVDKVFVGDTVTVQFARLSQKVQDAVLFSTDPISRGAGLEVSGIIGITALGQLKIEIDYRDGLMKFTYDPDRGYKY